MGRFGIREDVRVQASCRSPSVPERTGRGGDPRLSGRGGLDHPAQGREARGGDVLYELLPLPDGTDRPVTFVFNGGPGSSSVYLHFGALGPRQGCVRSPGRARCRRPTSSRTTGRPGSGSRTWSSSIPSARGCPG
ncbi:MAG: hypothetical protein M0C28_30215 [Candidatus Moduliflexus flocculans]|nr:hypothetical protein [Candidatus Moduliflexus flocculans]